MTLRIGILPGDDIGLEVVPECIKVLKAAAACERLEIDWRPLPIGKRGHEQHGKTLPAVTEQALRELDGRRISIVGDVLHSRVARSNVLLLAALGAEVSLVGPPTLLPVGVDHWPCATSYDLDSVLPKTDAVMMLRVQRERMNASFFPTEREYSRRYGLDARRMATLPDHAIVLHPGPMNRGMEINADVADSDRSVIVEQVTNGVAVRMAVLYLLLGGATEGENA